jgi:hypothetical protein
VIGWKVLLCSCSFLLRMVVLQWMCYGPADSVLAGRRYVSWCHGSCATPAPFLQLLTHVRALAVPAGVCRPGTDALCMHALNVLS